MSDRDFFEDQVDSIENNDDAGSEKERLLDPIFELSDNDYHKQLNSMAPPDEDIIKMDTPISQMEIHSILNSLDSPLYSKALQTTLQCFSQISVSLLQEYVKIVLQKRYFSGREVRGIVQNALFVRGIIGKISSAEEDRYSCLLTELTDFTHPFYNCYYSVSEFLKAIATYSEDHNHEEVTQLYSSLELVISKEKKEGLQLGQLLIKWVSLLICQNCIRLSESNKLTNLIILSKVSQQSRESSILSENSLQLLELSEEQYLQIPKYALQNYCTGVFELTHRSEKYTKDYLLPLIEHNLKEHSSLEKKVLGFKMLVSCVQSSKLQPHLPNLLLEWFEQQQIILKYLREDTQAQILRKMPVIVRFVYQYDALPFAYILKIVGDSLHAGEEMVKVVQSLLQCLKLTHLEEIVNCLKRPELVDSSQMAVLMGSLASNPHLGVRVGKQNILKALNEGESPSESDESLNNPQVQRIINNIFSFLIRVLDNHQQAYMNIVAHLISTHHHFLRQQLEEEIMSLLKTGKTCVTWLLEHTLKGESVKETHQAWKKQLISRLAGEGLYEYLLAMLAQNRYNRAVADKILGVVGLLCRLHKPLEKSQLEFLWRVVGLKARDEREREQFFLFLKEAFRYQNSLTEECVNYIYFDVLMRQHADWFSMRVYECLEMLFLRLNEDCHLLAYTAEVYEVHEPDLIGLDKLWYIYFNVPDQKVAKKCRDFLWRLFKYESPCKSKMVNASVLAVIKYLEHTLQLPQNLEARRCLLQRGFDLVQKMLQENRDEQLKEDSRLSVMIQNCTANCLPPKKKQLEVSVKTTLHELRVLVAENLHPIVRNIELITKGNSLRGEKMTLKELGIENGQTIMAQDTFQVQNSTKIARQQEYKETLLSLLGQEHTQKFIQFIVLRFQGDSLEHIVTFLLDQERMSELKIRFQQEQEKASENLPCFEVEEVGNIVQQERSFGQTLALDQANVFTLLKCCRALDNPKQVWEIMKKLPTNEAIAGQIGDRIREHNWREVFSGSCEDSLYRLHLVSVYIKLNHNKVQILEGLGFRKFLTEWANTLLHKADSSQLLLEEIFKIVFSSLQCPAFDDLEAALTDKFNFSDFLKQEPIQIELQYQSYIGDTLCQGVFAFLRDHTVSQHLLLGFVRILLCQIYFPQKGQVFSLLDQSPQSLHKLLLKYGRAFEYCVLATVVMERERHPSSFTATCSRFTQQLCSFTNAKVLSESNQNYCSYFECLLALIGVSRGEREEFEQCLLEKIITGLQTDIVSLLEEQVVGHFQIVLAIMRKPEKTKHKQCSLVEFSLWLFDGYLFELNAPKPYFRNKAIRKTIYDILKLQCEHEEVKSLLVASIAKLSVVPCLNEEQNVDFREKQFIGLKNLGATCYINSLLQQLFHTKLPRRMIQETQGMGQIKMLEIKKVFVNLQLSNKNVINPAAFISSMRLNGQEINPRVQQDATEFLMSLLDYIEYEGGKNIVEDIYGGTLWNQIIGLEDGSEFVKTNSEKFNTLSLDIKGKKNLLEAFTYFTKGEVLDGENMYFCEDFNRKTKAMRKTFLDKLPALLILTLKRFEFDHEAMARHKLNDYFEFPLELDLQKYSCPAKRDNPELDSSLFKYRLVGILVHSGSAESGHYYSYIKVGEKWFEFNDRVVSEFNLQANLKSECFGGSEEKTRSAYMLFYEKQNGNAHGVDLHELPADNPVVVSLKAENEAFLRNRLIYDAHFIDFLKSLSLAYPCQEINTILDLLCPIPKKKSEMMEIEDKKEEGYMII